MEYNELVKKAIEARENAYVPYSNFKVGCAVIMDGTVFTGCNVENVSYGASNCAERTAIFKGVSEGKKNISALAVVGSLKDLTFPCGICRQVILEFAENDEIPIIVGKSEDDFIVKKFKDILPEGFSKNFSKLFKED